MTFLPCLVRSSTPAGEVRFELGHPLLDRYLEFVAGRTRPNTVLAVAFDLKTFFTVVDKEPAEVAAVDMLYFSPISVATGRSCGWRTGSPACRLAPSPGASRRCRGSTRICSPEATPA